MADTTDVPDSSDSPESPPSALQTFLRAAQRRECLRMLAGALRLAASLEVDFATVTPEELDQLAAEHDLETLAQAAAAELGTDSREVFALARTITDLVVTEMRARPAVADALVDMLDRQIAALLE